MLWHIVYVAAVVVSVAGHGRVLEPPGRSSIWRKGFPAVPYYDDDALNCGGFYNQHGVNGGKCGVCGDPYDHPEPRPHEAGGYLNTGIIVARYEQGQVIDIVVELTAYHKGYFEFRICTDPLSNKQDCFDEILLELEDGGTKYYPWKDGVYPMKFRLPSDLVCDHCVLQWKYTCGNNWGVCNNGTQGVGCGQQETFWACTDISISPVGNALDAPVELEPAPLPVILSNSIDEVQGLLELLRKSVVRAKPPKRDTPISYQRKNHRRKHRSKKNKPRKRKKIIWNLF